MSFLRSCPFWHLSIPQKGSNLSTGFSRGSITFRLIMMLSEFQEMAVVLESSGVLHSSTIADFEKAVEEDTDSSHLLRGIGASSLFGSIIN